MKFKFFNKLNINILLIIIIIFIICYVLNNKINNNLEGLNQDVDISFKFNSSNIKIHKILNHIAINYFNSKMKAELLLDPKNIDIDKLKNINPTKINDELRNIREHLNDLTFTEIDYLLSYANFYKRSIKMISGINNEKNKDKLKLYLKIIDAGIVELKYAKIVKENIIDNKTSDESVKQLYSQFGDAACLIGETYQNGICCPANEINTNGICCPPNNANVNGSCCANNKVTKDGVCCPDDKVNTNGICCPPGNINANGICCPPGNINANGICCPRGDINVDGKCQTPYVKTSCDSKNNGYIDFNNNWNLYKMTNGHTISSSFNVDTCKASCDRDPTCDAYFMRTISDTTYTPGKIGNCMGGKYNINGSDINKTQLLCGPPNGQFGNIKSNIPYTIAK